jgi:hypothetical protein
MIIKLFKHVEGLDPSVYGVCMFACMYMPAHMQACVCAYMHTVCSVKFILYKIAKLFKNKSLNVSLY